MPSDLGYDCVIVTTGDVVAAVHWSYGSDSPPDNACTRGRSTTLASSSGFMHVAVEAPEAGEAAVVDTRFGRGGVGGGDSSTSYAGMSVWVYARCPAFMNSRQK